MRSDAPAPWGFSDALADALADPAHDHEHETFGQPSFASLPDATAVADVFTTVHRSVYPRFQTFVGSKFHVHHAHFRFSCVTAAGQTCSYFMDFSSLDGKETHYCGTEAGRAKWAHMMDTLPAGAVETLPDGRRVPAPLNRSHTEHWPRVIVSGDTSLSNVLVPDNTPPVAATGHTVRDVKDFAVDYLRRHGTYRTFKGKAGPRNLCTDFAAAAYGHFTSYPGIRDPPRRTTWLGGTPERVRPFMCTKSKLFHATTGPVAFALACAGVTPKWHLRMQEAQPLAKPRHLRRQNALARTRCRGYEDTPSPHHAPVPAGCGQPPRQLRSCRDDVDCASASRAPQPQREHLWMSR